MSLAVAVESAMSSDGDRAAGVRKSNDDLADFVRSIIKLRDYNPTGFELLHTLMRALVGDIVLTRKQRARLIARARLNGGDIIAERFEANLTARGL